MTANFDQIPLYSKLPESSREFLNKITTTYRFSFQQVRQLVLFEADLFCWQTGSIEQFYHPERLAITRDKKGIKKLFTIFETEYESLKNNPKRYDNTGSEIVETKSFKEKIVTKPLTGDIMGQCPVASEKTRCCNLQTLDAVRQCGFGCSYCSIQSFYHNNEVSFIEDFAEHLQNLSLDPNDTYHIGTGQSSDSLMWGNKNGLFENLCEFAAKNPNVILEMKSKSGNIGYFLKNKPPKNMLFTWSLNTDSIIAAEEKGTASLEKRLKSARKLADLGIPVGFHFHPMVWYEDWQDEYRNVVRLLTELFEPEEVVLVSIGTLTFIKPVLKQIRERMLKSSILQMPMVDSAGKSSYPFEIKKDLFSTVYNAFADDWKNEVFFYMCMEDERLWQPVLGRSYGTNEEFQEDMLRSYRDKIDSIASRS